MRAEESFGKDYCSAYLLLKRAMWMEEEEEQEEMN